MSRRPRRPGSPDRPALPTDPADPLAEVAPSSPPREVIGFYDTDGRGRAVLRLDEDLRHRHQDPRVAPHLAERFGLRRGDLVRGVARPPHAGDAYWALTEIRDVYGLDAAASRRRRKFDELTPIHPNRRIPLEHDAGELTSRMIDLVAPIGHGQRALVVAPPKAGKTHVLRAIANGARANDPALEIYVLLVGERPEEVTDMRRNVPGTVFGATFDEHTEVHTALAELVTEIAKRRVELGRDVLLLVDSLTRAARAYNLDLPPSGRLLSGGMDAVALYPPKRLFGAARAMEEGGALTVVATCLVDTGSKLDDVVYEEFKGTGNSELILDRRMAEKRIFPAIDIPRSGTRREDLLFDEGALRMIFVLRRMLAAAGPDGPEILLARLKKSASNAEFLASLAAAGANGKE